MQVVMLAGHAPGWRHNWEQAARRVAEVVTVRTTRDRPAGGWRRSAPFEYEVALTTLQPESLVAAVNSRVMRRRFAALFEAIRTEHGPIDLLHAHFYSAALDVADLGIPYVVSEHTTVFTRPERPAVVRRSARAAQAVYDAAACVMPVSRSLEDDLRRAGLTFRSSVVPNPVDPDQFAWTPRTSDAAGLRVLFAQRLARTKGADVLLRAVAGVRARGRDCSVRIAGAGPEREALQHLAASLGLTAAVEFLGPLSLAEVAAEMRAASVFAFPSRGDSFGLPVVEALCTGLPVIATPLGVVPEVLTAARGIVVPVDDVDAWVDALLEIAERRDAFPAEAVAAGIRDEFSLEAVGRRLEQVYARAIAR